jgi:hypothetical protein
VRRSALACRAQLFLGNCRIAIAVYQFRPFFA